MGVYKKATAFVSQLKKLHFLDLSVQCINATFLIFMTFEAIIFHLNLLLATSHNCPNIYVPYIAGNFFNFTKFLFLIKNIYVLITSIV